MHTEFKTFLKHLGFEAKRPVVILLVLTAAFASLSYLGIITWTSQALTHSIPENLAGIIIGLAGIFGTISGIIVGLIIKRIGVKIAIIIGVISLFISLFILINTGDITNIEKLPLVSMGFIFSGIAGGTFIPTVMFYSQTLSLERRGALAGLATAGQFIGTALVPIIYKPFFDQEGIVLVYFMIVIVASLLTIVISLLYVVSKRKKKV
jgi:MFS family permease